MRPLVFSHRVIFSQLFLLSFLCISIPTVLVILSTLILPYWIQIINLIKPVLTRIENSNWCQTFFFALTKTFISWQQTHLAIQLEPELRILAYFDYFLVAKAYLSLHLIPTLFEWWFEWVKHFVKYSVKSVFGSSSLSAESSSVIGSQVKSSPSNLRGFDGWWRWFNYL